MNKRELKWRYHRATEDGTVIKEYISDILTLYDLQLRFVCKEYAPNRLVQLFLEQEFAGKSMYAQIGGYQTVLEAQEAALKEFGYLKQDIYIQLPIKKK